MEKLFFREVEVPLSKKRNSEKKSMQILLYGILMPKLSYRKKTHHQNCDSNIYDKFYIKGQAETVFHKGKMVINKRKLNDIYQKGIYLAQM